jgi:hypothetical protein
MPAARCRELTDRLLGPDKLNCLASIALCSMSIPLLSALSVYGFVPGERRCSLVLVIDPPFGSLNKSALPGGYNRQALYPPRNAAMASAVVSKQLFRPFYKGPPLLITLITPDPHA